MGKMAKTAKLVLVSMMVRVICEHDETEGTVVGKSRPLLLDLVRNELYENLVDIIDDVECPYGTLDGDLV